MQRLKKYPFWRSPLFYVLFLSGIIIWWFWFLLPDPLFEEPTCTVLRDRDGQLLGARIAADEQWRFPPRDTVPDKFEQCIVQFEDQRFYYHLGIDPLAIARALWQNIKTGKVVSGGSTITMQVIRLSRENRSRTVWEKMKEAVLAFRLELSYTKEEVLAFYAGHAPYGGNVVGLPAAAWRYFGRRPGQLSWGETATLAVLPNTPALIHPGRNQDRLRAKRNRLLDRLETEGVIDSTTCRLAKAEPLPGAPQPLPQKALHLLARVDAEHFRDPSSNKRSNFRSTLDAALQENVNRIVQKHHHRLKGNGIHNMAVLVAEVSTGDVRAYVGNVYRPGQPAANSHVDVVTAPRSTGSILKPFLFAAMLDQGALLPKTLVPDIPTRIAGYAPKNFNRGYDGAVPARQALARSLNVPAVRMLRQFGVSKFHYYLKKLGLQTLDYPPDHYGLSLILGGAEGTLWDITGIYASMARTLNHYIDYSARYDPSGFHSLNYDWAERDTSSPSPSSLEKTSVLGAGAIWHTFKAMLEVERPLDDRNWRTFASSQQIAWKTGTSFGFRDGWAVGCTPHFVVGVWVGNADGEGRPGLTGLGAAAPVLFDVFDLVKTGAWFEQPYDALYKITTCRKSGYRTTSACQPVDTTWVPGAGKRTTPCPYHKIVHLDLQKEWRVRSSCRNPSRMQHQPWFVLPPAMEWYYKRQHHGYRVLPPYHPDCRDNGSYQQAMQLIYPTHTAKIYIPLELDGERGKTVFEVAHRQEKATIFWHLDDRYLGKTERFHQMALRPTPGWHTLTLVDQNGNRLTEKIKILEKSS